MSYSKVLYLGLFSLVVILAFLALSEYIYIASALSPSSASMVSIKVNTSFATRYILTPVKDVYMWIVVTAVNSPYNGEAYIEKTYTYSIDYGFIATHKVTITTQTKLSAVNGASAALIQLWHLRVYDVLECKAGCVPRGYVVVPLEKALPNDAIYSYQDPGSLVDDNIVEVYTFTPSHELIGYQIFDPSFHYTDKYIIIYPGQGTCISYKITYENQAGSSIDISIGVNLGESIAVSIGVAKLAFTSSVANEAFYKFCASKKYTEIYLIDYKGTVQGKKLPLIWSFHTILLSGSSASKGYVNKIIKEITANSEVTIPRKVKKYYLINPLQNETG